MMDRLPIDNERYELPVDKLEVMNEEKKRNSYGYVSFLYLFSLLITLGSVITIIIVRS